MEPLSRNSVQLDYQNFILFGKDPNDDFKGGLIDCLDDVEDHANAIAILRKIATYLEKKMIAENGENEGQGMVERAMLDWKGNQKTMSNIDFNLQFGHEVNDIRMVIPFNLIDRMRKDMQEELHKGLVQIKDQFLYHSIMDHSEALDEGPMYTFKLTKSRSIHIWNVNEMIWVEVEGENEKDLTKIYLTVNSRIEPVILQDEEELPHPMMKAKRKDDEDEIVDEDETLAIKDARGTSLNREDLETLLEFAESFGPNGMGTDAGYLYDKLCDLYNSTEGNIKPGSQLERRLILREKLEPIIESETKTYIGIPKEETKGEYLARREKETRANLKKG